MTRTRCTIALVVSLAALCLATPASAEYERVRPFPPDAYEGDDGGGGFDIYGVDRAGSVYGAMGQGMVKLSPEGKLLAKLPPVPYEGCEHGGPSRRDVAADGTIFVTEDCYGDAPDRLLKLSPGGTWRAYSTQLPFMIDIAAGDRYVYVTYASGASPDPHIARFSTNGVFQTQWQVVLPSDCRCLGSFPVGADHANDDVYVGLGGSLVRRYSSGGQQLAQWGGDGDSPGQFTGPIQGIDVDSLERVWVVNESLGFGSSGRIQAFTRTGGYLTGIPDVLECCTDVNVGPTGVLDRGPRLYVFTNDLWEYRDLAPLNLKVEARWKQTKRKLVVNTNCNQPCSLDFSVYVRAGKKVIEKLGRSVEDFSDKRRAVTIRFNRDLRQEIAKAHARGKKVRVQVWSSAFNELHDDFFSDDGDYPTYDEECQLIAIPRPEQPRGAAAAKC